MALRAYIFLLFVMTACSTGDLSHKESAIQAASDYPQYWEYHGNPVLLLGGSDEDNLFQLQGLEEQLDLLASLGGNYVRNTMSSRDSGNVWAFHMDPSSGQYDLRAWNETYWERFTNLLELTSEKKIFVQVEIWATFDFYRENWDKNPFNPVNNINYTAERTKLPEKVATHPTRCDNPFFWSIPSHDNNMPLLGYQQRYVDKLLSISLDFDHVLYCIDNETSVTSEWGKFWSEYIRKKAAEKDKTIQVTEMWDPWDLDHISHRESFDHPGTYSYVEISQNNHQRGEQQWENGLHQIEKLKAAGRLRPVNNVKTYGSDAGRHGGGTQNGIESFVRSTLFGSAAVRFHRPPSGLGLGEEAQAVIKGLREATDLVDFFNAKPDNELLGGRQENEAYCRAVPGKDYLVYFPNEGEVELDLGKAASDMKASRLELLEGKWTEMDLEPENGQVKLDSPGKHFIYVLKKR